MSKLLLATNLHERHLEWLAGPGHHQRRRAFMRQLYGTILLASCLLLSGVVRADGCGPSPGGPPTACAASSPAGLDASSGPGAGAGNPINVITGNKYQREDDMPALPGVLGLEIVRHYNSAYIKPNSPNGPMGREWKLSYETELFDKFGRIQILQADGTRIIFDRDPNNPNLCSNRLPANGRMTFARRPDGMTDYTWTWPNGRRLYFNNWGKLVSIVAPTGEAVSLQYDPTNVLVTVTDPRGRSLHLGYLDRATARAGDRFRGVQYIDSPVGRYTYEYGSAVPKGSILFDTRILWANLVRVRLPTTYEPDHKAHPLADRGTTTSAVSRIYHHEDPRFPWLLTGISIETIGTDGKRTTARYATYGYDANGLANLSTHAEHVDQVTLAMGEGGKTVLTNSLGQQTVYRHAIIGDAQRLLEVRGAGCATCGETNVRYGYDKLGQLLETTRLSENGEPVSAIRRALDKLGRVFTVSTVNYRNGKPEPAQWRVRMEYQGDGSAPVLIARPSVVPGKELQMRIAYNLVGQPLSVTEAGWIPTYDGKQAAGQIMRTTTYQYATINGRSLLTRIDGPLPNGKTNSPLDSDVTVLEYDNHPNGEIEKKSVVKPGQLEQYDKREKRDGVLTAITTPGNFRSTLKYDSAGRIASITDASGHRTDFSYMPRGRMISQTRDGISYKTTFDSLDNPIEVGYSDKAGHDVQTRLGYDAAGRPIWSASHLGILTTRRYDTEDRLLESTTQSSAIRQARTYAYDPLGHLLAATDAGGGRWNISWNERDLPSEVTDAVGRVTRYHYDPSGNIIGVTPAANTPEALLHNTETRFELAVNGQPTGVTAPNGTTIRYIRDDFNQTVTTISPDSGVTSKQFDSAGRLISSTDAKGNQASYEYDAAGRIARQTIVDAGAPPGHRQTVTTWRYAGAHLVAVDHPDQAERYSYDVNGRVSVKTIIVTLANGAQASYNTRYRYDSLGQLAGVSLPDGSTLHYRRNGQDQIVALDRNVVHTSWLRWLLPRQTIVKDLERDAVGLKHLTYGNGIEAIYQRSKEGALARIAYRDPRQNNADQQRSAALKSLLGISQALAATTTHGAKQLRPAGALGMPPDPAAMLDHRYLWDVQGNLLHTKDQDAASNYAYDAFDRLIAAGTAPSTPKGTATFDRYYFDAGGNRLLAQEGIASQNDTRGNTIKASYAPDSNRWQGSESETGPVAANYDAAGQPEHIGQRSYTWDALGKLLEVRQGRDQLARYRYNHRGQRIAKDVRGTQTYYLYDDNRNLTAELDAGGKVSRQYVYLAGQPVAVIDTATAFTGHEEKRTPLAQAMADIAAIWQAWFGQRETVAFLFNNHLGATELVTDAKGKPVWQAAYTPFGKVRETSMRGKAGSSTFQFNLRLPGQYADQETGLYYNDHRYYDPGQGRYLTPDPLGLRGGGNGYAYVSGNPLKFIDPYGLILFAFDGTGNSETPAPTDSISNVRKFYEVYDQTKNGNKYYITGIGTTNADMPYAGSVITGDGFDQRVTLGFSFLDHLIRTDTDTSILNIDVVGFSRGAAEARVWMNALVGKLKDGAYTTDGKSRCVNLRFEGLWDTVPHLGRLHGDESKYDFSIPAAVKFAAQAVALNEHRGTLADFNLRSIMDSPAQASSATRIEKGFIGSHSDIGGGFGTGDLSDVALKWMLEQARTQGISIVDKTVSDNGWNVVTNPIVHDKSANRFTGGVITDTRSIVYSDGNKVPATNAVIDGKRTSDTTDDINYFPNPYRCGTDDNPDVGLVNMTKYNLWLASYGITMPTGPIVNSSCRP